MVEYIKTSINASHHVHTHTRTHTHTHTHTHTQGVLLYGPPGTGKTLLARAVAHHTECCFIRVSGSELVQKYIGEGSRMVRELFVMAREHAPSIIFMDEIDSIGSSRLGGGSGGEPGWEKGGGCVVSSKKFIHFCPTFLFLLLLPSPFSSPLFFLLILSFLFSPSFLTFLLPPFSSSLSPSPSHRRQ